MELLNSKPIAFESNVKLLDLNEDCLIYLCRYLDAEAIVSFAATCSRLKYVAEDFFEFKRSITCCIGSPENEAMAAKAIRKIGKYFTKIDLMCDLGFEISQPLFACITESAGRNLISLSILGNICSMPYAVLAPILSQLEVLTLQNSCGYDDCAATIDLPTLCPNLRELTVRGEVVFVTQSRTSFRRLEYLDVAFASNQSSDAVFFLNGQLKRLNLWNRRTISNKVKTDTINLNDLRRHLVNLEELHLDFYFIGSPVELAKIGDFRNLHTLALYNIPAASLIGILKILESFVRLKGIVLQSDVTQLDVQFSPIQESLVRIATTLTELQSFATVNIDWTTDSVGEFVRQAPNLVYFDFWYGSVSNRIVTPAFIRELAAKRKSSMMQPLTLKMYKMDKHLKQVFNEPDVASFLKLSK